MNYLNIMPNDVLELKPNTMRKYALLDKRVLVSRLQDRKGYKVGLIVDIEGRYFKPSDFKGRIGTWG